VDARAAVAPGAGVPRPTADSLRLGLLRLTARLAAAGDPAQILDVMSAECSDTLGVDLVNISLLDSDGTTLRLVSSFSTPMEVAEEFATYPLDAPLPSRDALAGDGQSIVLRSIAERDARYPQLQGVDVEQNAFMILPLRTARARLGVLGLGWHDPEDLTEDVVEACTTTADLCSAALERALAARAEVRARRRAQGALGRLQLLQRLTTELAHTTDVHLAGEIIVRRAVDALGAQAATIHLLDDTGTQATQIATSGLDSSAIAARTTWAVSDSDVASELMRTREPVVIRSRRERDERFGSFVQRRITNQAAWVTLLLTIGDRPVGIAAFGWHDPRDFDDDDLGLLQALGSHAAAAIERARLIEREQDQRERAERANRRLRLLSDVGRVLDDAHTVAEAFELVCSSVLRDHAEWCRSSEPAPGAAADPSPLDDPAAAEAAQTAARTGVVAAFLVMDGDDVVADCLALPIRALGTDGAAFLVGRSPGNPFSDADRGTLGEVARRLSNRLDNLHLLDEQTRIAFRLQESLLPAPFPVVDWLALGSAYGPAEVAADVCGDFYDVFPASDGDIVLVIGDVVGRGIEAAGLTGMARHTLRALAADLAPDAALRRLNAALLQDASTTTRDSLLTAACLRVRRTPTGAVVTMALGGHCLPVVVNDAGAMSVGAPGTLLGAFDTVRHPVTTLELVPGDAIVLYTDGVIEAKGDRDMFGDDRLLDLLRDRHDLHPQRLADAVLDTVRGFRRSAPDDMAVLVARIT
jgi:serine phosphatase RsbU (regulator of sigma subunit)/transcriptional regulator with GAF, ATPase, and Fis domain